jgi:hypothetical protein
MEPMAEVTEGAIQRCQAKLQFMEEEERRPGVEGSRMISYATYHLHRWAVAFVAHWERLGGVHGTVVLRSRDAIGRAERWLQRLHNVAAVHQEPSC